MSKAGDTGALRRFYGHRLNIHPEWDAADKERIPAIVSIFPAKVDGEVLEVGSAGGKVFNELKGKTERLTAADFSFEAVRSLKGGKRVVADASALPFKDLSFAVSVSADMLEHLKDEELPRAVSEMGRVSQKQILINVPHREVIEGAVARCLECGIEFNVYGHLRSFTRRGLERLFAAAGFYPIAVRIVGQRRRWRSALLFRLARKFGRAYSAEYTVCPQCGSGKMNPERGVFHKAAGRAIYALQLCVDALVPSVLKPRAEIIILFERR